MTTVNVCFRMDEKEREFLEKVISERNITLSDYLRELVVNALLSEVAKQGKVPDDLKRAILNSIIR